MHRTFYLLYPCEQNITLMQFSEVVSDVPRGSKDTLHCKLSASELIEYSGMTTFLPTYSLFTLIYGSVGIVVNLILVMAIVFRSVRNIIRSILCWMIL